MDPSDAPGDFFGREVEMAALESHAIGVTVIAGGSGIGKTSLVKRLQRAWSQEGERRPFPVYVQMSGFVATAETTGLHWLEYLLYYLERARGVTSPVAPRLQYIPQFADVIARVANELAATARAHRGIVFLIDEADHLLPFADQVSAVVQNLREAQDNTRYTLGFVFAGSRDVCDFREKRGSRLFRKAHIIVLGPLADGTSAALVQAANVHSPEEILSSAGGHPLLLRGLIDALEGSHVQVDAAVERVLTERVEVLRSLWHGQNGLRKSERDLYLRIVREGLPDASDISIATVRRFEPSLTPNDAISYLKALYAHGFLRNGSKDGTFRLGGRLLIEFARRENRPRASPRGDFVPGTTEWSLLAAFVYHDLPGVKEHAGVDRGLRALRTIAGLKARFVGHGGGATVAEQQARALYTCMVLEDKLIYVAPPADYVPGGQRPRPAAEVLETRSGTCLDLALLYAAVLESVGLHAVLFLRRGHCLAGFWAGESRASSPVCLEHAVVLEAISQRVLLPVETVLLDHQRPGDFDEATGVGERIVRDPAGFLAMVDVRRCREDGILPQEHPI
jgi:hypothetical protein